MITPKRWKKLLNNNFLSTNVSAYNSKKAIYGFSKNRIDVWKNNLEIWEIDLIEYLCKSRMKKLGYKVSEKQTSFYKKGLKIISNDFLLRKRLKFFQRYNRATDEKLNNAKDPKNWAVSVKNINKKFKDTPEYKSYIEEIKLINKESRHIN